MHRIKFILNKLFYNPYRFVNKYQNIDIGENVVLFKSCKFEFEFENNNNAVSIGKNSMIGGKIVFESTEGQVLIGENTFINGGSTLISRSEICIGSNVTIAWGCTIYDHNSHSLNYLDRRGDVANQIVAHKSGGSIVKNKDWSTVSSSKIIIGDDVWIGFGSIILKGVTIGEGSIVGAGSVVRESVEPWTVVAGNPAVEIKKLKRRAF
jgi:acetyltransferase-like isoleucine patch superfamily enzyme